MEARKLAEKTALIQQKKLQSRAESLAKTGRLIR